MNGPLTHRFGAAFLALAIAGTAMAVQPAMAKNGHNAAAIAGGLLGGVAAGAIISGAGRPAYPAYPTYPAYQAAPVYEAPDCDAAQPVYDSYGNFAGYQRVPGC